ncbi:MAG: helix-turn-helix domain-containing protein [Lysobacteraceae bacterium]
MNKQVKRRNSPPPIAETHRVSDLAVLKLLSDPLKLKLLQAFAEGPRSTMQVAEALGENLTKLYRHVDALTEAGLLVVTEETPKRGTVERKFRAVARRFEVDRSLLSSDADPDGTEAVRGILRDGEDDIVRALSNKERGADDDLLARLKGKASPKRIKQLKQQLADWLDAVQREDADDDEATEEFGVLLAFYRSAPANDQ